MNRILIFMAEGVEEVEALTVVDLLRRQKCDIDMVTINDSRLVTGSHNIILSADKSITEADIGSYDVLVIPGGLKGTQNLKQEPVVLNTIRDYDAAGKLICAICAGPTVLAAAGITNGHNISSYPGTEGDLNGGIAHPEKEVSVDGNIITSRGLGTAIPFALSIIEYLFGKEASEEMQKKIVYNVTG